MALIGNEIKYCEKHLNNNTIDNNHVRTAVIMVKYFFLVKEYSQPQIKQELLSYLERVNVKLDNDLIDKLIKSNTSDKTTLNTLESISITETEWDTIQELGRNERERKLLFTLLCMYKIKVGCGYEANNTVKVNYTTLNSDAHITLTKKQRVETFSYLIQAGAISIGFGQMAKKIELFYVNNESPIKMEITEFDCLHVYYEYLKKGGRLIFCQECGDLVVAKSNNSKYCNDCAKTKTNQQKLNHKKRKSDL